MEKRRRCADAGKLVFIGMADVAEYYWCAGQSLIKNMVMEPYFFGAYLVDRLSYSKLLGKVDKLPRTPDELLKVGDDLTIDDVERLLKEQPLKEPVAGGLPEDIESLLKEPADSKQLAAAKGIVAEAVVAEKYPTIRWNFPWRSRVVVGVPDGIGDRFVYEFKATKNKFLALFRKACCASPSGPLRHVLQAAGGFGNFMRVPLGRHGKTGETGALIQRKASAKSPHVPRRTGVRRSSSSSQRSARTGLRK